MSSIDEDIDAKYEEIGQKLLDIWDSDMDFDLLTSNLKRREEKPKPEYKFSWECEKRRGKVTADTVIYDEFPKWLPTKRI